MLALVKVTPPTVLVVVDASSMRVNVAGTWQQDGATAGWQSPDGAYKVVAVSTFVVPNGQVTVGSPSYAIDGQLNVTETYATQAAPVVVPQSISRRQYYQQCVVMGWITQAEANALATTMTIPASILAFINNLPVGQRFAATFFILMEPVYYRNNTFLNSLWTAGGVTSQMDAFFEAAAQL